MHAAPEHPVAPDEVLDAAELQRLTFWKWRYSLEAMGFTTAQASELAFLAWLRAAGRC